MISTSSLNHIYRTVWNEALGAMVAVAELSPARGKAANRSSGSNSRVAARSQIPKLAITALAVATAWCASMPFAAANPTGANAIHGQASLTANGNQLLVNTQNGAGTNHSAINWQSFSIPAGSSTYFQQPDASSTSINRVVTNTPSLIFGTLGSNGKLVLVNQSGITVGAGALVDTAGFTASALRMTDADAIAGRLRFGDASVAAGDVSVQGRILARSGDVVLLGSNVLAGADALVQAPNGNTILAAGQQIEITARGLEGITLQVQAPADSVVNLGNLQGDAVGIFAGTLKHSGNIQATAVSAEGGRVFLKAANTATVDGSVTARALNGVGGTVRATANTVVLQSGALIDVSGTNGGGEALIGGGFHGADSRLANANVTIVEAGARINADAGAVGDGGTVVVWADGATSYQGSISARGGAAGGNGGNAEVSGKKYLDFRGGVDLTAAAGQKGTLLLDPDNLTIGDSLAVSDFPNLDQTGIALADLPLNSTITSTQVGALLETGNLKLEAAQDITMLASISKTLGPSSSLELHAGHDVNLNSNFIVTSPGLGAGPLDIKITADTGSVLGSANFVTGGGKVEVFATTGSISLNSVNTSDQLFSVGGNAGNVTLAAGTSVAVNTIDARGADGNFVNTTGGNGGNVLITTSAINVPTTITPGLVAAEGGGAGYGGTVGLGGLINLKSINGDLAFGGRFSTSGAVRNVDTVLIEAPNGGVTTASWNYCPDGCSLIADSTINSGGGQITVAATGSVDLTNVSTFQSLGKYQANAGNVNISSTAADISIGSVESYGNGSSFLNGGAGGDINVSALSGNVLVQNVLNASGGNGAFADGAGGTGGNVNINAGGTYDGSAASIYTYGGSGNSLGGPTNGANGGNVSIAANGPNAAATVSHLRFIDASGGFSGAGGVGGNGGTVTVTAAHNLTLEGSVYTSGEIGSVSGAITVQAAGSVALNSAACEGACTMSGGTIRVVAGGNLSDDIDVISDASGDAIVMSAANGVFTGGVNAGASATNGRILLSLTQNGANDFGPLGALFTFKQYNVSYSLGGGFTYTDTGLANSSLAQLPPGGVGLLYTDTRTLSGVSSAPLSARIYDGTDVADVSAATFFAVGNVPGDVVTLNATRVTGTYADKNAGIGKVVTATGFTSTVTDSALGNIPVYGYLFNGQALTTGDITPRALSTFVGSGGNWSNAANWDVLPDGANVLAVAIPSAVSVTYDAAAGATTLQSVNSLGAFTMAGGNLGVTQSLNAAQYLQTGGTVSGPGSFTVTNSFTQTGGAVAMTGPVAITQATGDLMVGSVSGSSVALTALTGAVMQTAAVQTPGQLTANAATGVVLTDAANSAAKFSATVSGAGNVAFTNTGALDVTGITVPNGDVVLDNTGAFSNSGAINAPQGAVLIAAHSPLSIGAGVLAGGNIQLAALTNNASSNIVVNGNLVSTAGGISAQAFNNYVQNGTLNAAQGINVTAGGSISFGPGAFSVGNPVNYTANGVAYTPPWVAGALTGGPTSFVADFLNQFQTALDAQIYAADDPLGKRQLASEGVVVEGNICPR